MSRYITTKVLSIIVLTALLLAGVQTVSRLIAERGKYQQTVIEEIANSSSRAQTLMGPILVVPYRIVSQAADEVIDIPRAGGGQENAQPASRDHRGQSQQTSAQWHQYYILPQTLHVTGETITTPRKLGVYQAQVYAAQMQFNGRFGQLKAHELLLRHDIQIGQPYIVVTMSDTRGILKTFPFILNGQPAEFKEGSNVSRLGRGIHVPVNARALLAADQENNFEFRLDIQGTQNLSVVPIGRESDWRMQSNWQHPNFVGTMLPRTHTVNRQGFHAQWESNWFANNLNEHFGNDLVPDLQKERLPTFSVSMVETVSQYQLNERTVKYAILIIGLVFIGFVMFEAVAHLKVHPVQYALVGMALVMFYLLLLALSEHVGFTKAYAIAAFCSSGLIGIYLCSVLRGIHRGAFFSIGLFLLYGVLFLILNSEDMALLLGSVLLFVVLAAIMLATRKVNWYQVTEVLEFNHITKKVQPSDADRSV